MAKVFDVENAPLLPNTILRHFCGADANVYVNHVASVIFNDFQLPVTGQYKIAVCLSNLPYVETADDRLAFGWGPDNIIRQPVIHQHGYESLAVTVALASTFHNSYAAEVCQAYAASMAGEDDMLPHIRQWRRALVASCGALTASEFGELVEEYIRLDPYSIAPGNNLIAKRCRVPAKAMAAGLMAVSKVIAKKETQVTLVGGAVIGWFAALAEFFYGLQAAILSRSGEKLHGDPHAQSTQVILVYHEEADLHVLTEHWATIQDNKGSDDDPFWTKNVHFLPFGGRLQWHSLLPQVFGRAYWVLEHEESRTLAEVIGSGARALEGDYEHHTTDDSDNRYNEGANPSAYGAGLVQNLNAWLPELRKGQGRMERQLKRAFQDAADTYEAGIAKLVQHCNCDVCSTTDSSSSSRRPAKDGYCLPVICETIIALGLAVSRIVVASGILPTREGVQGIYSSQAAKRREAKHFDVKKMPDRLQHYAIIYQNEWKAGDSRRLQNAVELFSGTRPEADVNDTLVAIAHEGIVAHMLSLVRSDAAPARESEKGFIQISSGAINLRQKVFTRVSTEQVTVTESSETLSWEEVKLKHLSKPLYFK